MIGAGKAGQAKVYARQSLVVTFAAGVILGALVFFSAEHLMRLMMIASENPDPEIIRLGATYLRIVALAEPLTFTMMNSYAILQGAGNMRAPLYIMGFANLLNVVFDYLLIFGIGFFPKWGWQELPSPAGSRIWRQLSPCSSCSASPALASASRTASGLSASASRKCGHRAALRRRAAGAQQRPAGLLHAGGQHGTRTIAANQIITKSSSISFMPGIGFTRSHYPGWPESRRRQPDRANAAGIWRQRWRPSLCPSWG